MESKPRIGLLYFGLLNSFEMIYSQPEKYHSIFGILKYLGIECDVYFDTSPLSFKKIMPTEMDKIDKFLGGKTLIDRVPAELDGGREYLIIQESQNQIKINLDHFFQKNLKYVHFSKADKATWSGENYILNMIHAFMERKNRLVRVAVEHAKQENFEYDILILARPDSATYLRKSRHASLAETSKAFANDLAALLSNNCILADMGAFDKVKSAPGHYIFKNDLLVGSVSNMLTISSLSDYLVENGGYHNKFNDKVFRCPECFTIFEGSSKPCPSCESMKFQEDKQARLGPWAEYKTARFAVMNGIQINELSVTGVVVRE